jgi:hydrogenase maturation protease
MEDGYNPAIRIGVIGLGNVLMSDDAFGPYIIEVLDSRYTFPKNVSLMDLGTPSLELVAYIQDLDALIIVDTVHSEGRAGELRAYRREEILKNPIQPRISPHEPGLKEALLIAEFDERSPREALLIGVIPEITTTGVGLSKPVRDTITRAVEEVISEIERLGTKAISRSVPLRPKIWWEEQARIF